MTALPETVGRAVLAPPDRAVQPTSRLVWRLTPTHDLPDGPADRLRGARLVVLGGDRDTARRVVLALRAAGANAVAAADGQPCLVDGELPDGLVDLTLDEPFVPGRHDAYRAALLRSVAALRGCYADWSQEVDAERLGYLAVTYLDGGMGYRGDAEIRQPLGGIWAGLAKTVHREIPNCNVKVVDVGAADLARLPEIVAAEFGRWGLFEIGWHGGRRHTLEPRRQDAAAPTVSLGRDDLVLVSGGGRGIGFRLAHSLAADFGCRVVVTGRGPLPTGAEPWAGLTDEEFRDFERGLWSAHREGRRVAEIRADIERLRRDRELYEHIVGARRDGLRIEYAPCDFTDAAQVSALLGRLGDDLTGVVHNAGIDSPTRLPKKSDEDFLRTVGTKIDGFVNLFERVRGRDLKFFCNVGSLTGRLGGMVGQLDYGAANDGLARLGLWAGHQVGFPVMTLCWPTWNQLGMVANFEATLRYMAALDIDEGIQRWQQELRAGSAEEITYVGPLGRALSPIQARGYPATRDLPGFAEVFPKIFHLGSVHTNAPHRSMLATVSLDQAWSPALTDFLVDGAEALPVSVLLDNAIWAAEWMQPDDLPDLRLDRIEDLVVHPDALRLVGGAVTLLRETTGGHRDGEWVVRAGYRDPARPEVEVEVAALRLVFRRAGDMPARPAAPGRGWRTPTEPAASRLRWRGLVFAAARGADAQVRPSPPEDVWAMPVAPVARLPLAAMENVLRFASGGAGARLAAARISLHDTTNGPTRILAGPAEGDWSALNAATGLPVFSVTGLTW
ncbi:KR domain-containing protein [Solihabitans fulvus]|uniref:KR domain-containing protein n=1 Tax=Solihabitans fulvus TaxID=1892852 RepID=A0A5B2WKE5_9PSEU|nr:KR domain-containing protein [Solihabitans fulvus]KAA2251230.1 KR domain-containing protein [Solihabitans fulvus]